MLRGRRSDQLFRRFAARRGVAPPPPTLRASTAFRFGAVVARFAAVFAALPVLALAAVFFALAAVAVLAFAVLAFAVLALVSSSWPSQPSASVGADCCLLIAAFVFSRLRAGRAGPSDSRRGSAFFFTGCQVCWDPIDALLAQLARGIVLREAPTLRVHPGIHFVLSAHMRNLSNAPTPPTSASNDASSMNLMRAAVCCARVTNSSDSFNRLSSIGPAGIRGGDLQRRPAPRPRAASGRASAFPARR